MNSPEEKPLRTAAEGVEGDALGGASATIPGTMESKSSSTWFALRNPVFFRLWLATLLSGTFVSSQDVTATWLMDYLGAFAVFALSDGNGCIRSVLSLHAASRGHC